MQLPSDAGSCKKHSFDLTPAEQHRWQCLDVSQGLCSRGHIIITGFHSDLDCGQDSEAAWQCENYHTKGCLNSNLLGDSHQERGIFAGIHTAFQCSDI